MENSPSSSHRFGIASGTDVTDVPCAKRLKLTCFERTRIWVDTGEAGVRLEDQVELAEEVNETNEDDADNADAGADDADTPNGMPVDNAREDHPKAPGDEGEVKTAEGHDPGPSGDPGYQGAALPGGQGPPATGAHDVPAMVSTQSSSASGRDGSRAASLTEVSSDDSESVIFIESSASNSDSGLGEM